tara:strand:+ start:107 stop:697 length:591 start_codon:yes stop_codon:yes gene_type:complete
MEANRPIYYKSHRSRSYKFIENNLPSLNDLIVNKKNILLDIGFGTGDSCIELQKLYPNKIIFGVEAYKPGVSRMIDKNIHSYYGDATKLIEETKSSSIDIIYILFPDPWPKKKHRKRRLVNEYTFKEFMRVLVPNGKLHFCTDNIGYAYETLIMINRILKIDLNFSKCRGDRPITKYEKKAYKKNNFIFDIIVYKK